MFKYMEDPFFSPSGMFMVDHRVFVIKDTNYYGLILMKGMSTSTDEFLQAQTVTSVKF